MYPLGFFLRELGRQALLDRRAADLLADLPACSMSLRLSGDDFGNPSGTSAGAKSKSTDQGSSSVLNCVQLSLRDDSDTDSESDTTGNSQNGKQKRKYAHTDTQMNWHHCRHQQDLVWDDFKSWGSKVLAAKRVKKRRSDSSLNGQNMGTSNAHLHGPCTAMCKILSMRQQKHSTQVDTGSPKEMEGHCRSWQLWGAMISPCDTASEPSESFSEHATVPAAPCVDAGTSRGLDKLVDDLF